MTSLPLYLTHRGETNKVTKNKLYRCGKCISQIGNRWLHLKRNRILKGGKRREGGKKWRKKKKNANVNTLCSLNEINVKWYVKKKKKWEYLWRFFSCLDKGATGRRGNAKPQSEAGKRAMRACLKRAHVEVRPPNHPNKKVASVFASTSLFRFIKWHPALAQ